MAASITKRIEFPPWYGEFGWEIASWVPLCRRQAKGYDEVMVSSFAGMEALYVDFATEFIAHSQTKRGLNYPKMYRPQGDYYRYGDAARADACFDCLIHARGIKRKDSINYRRWPELTELLAELDVSVACIGGGEDIAVDGIEDMRCIELINLMDLIDAAKIVIGVSSGVMHLAAFCGTNLVIWGDRRTYFGETLEHRYKVTWNPFDVKVGWIDTDNFQPGAQEIIEKVKELL